jgi:two-component system LytT family response regulator
MQQGLRVLIVDDERAARVNVRHLLGVHPRVSDCREADGGEAAIRAIGEAPPDLIFLDVDMPEVGGFDVIRRVGPARMPDVIFLTAYDQFAVRAFTVNAVDYLLKPVATERFDEAFARALARRSRAELATQGRRLAALVGEVPEIATTEAFVPLRDHSGRLEGFVVREGRRNTVLLPEEIVWLSAEDYCTSVHTLVATYLVRATLTAILAQLDPARFVRVHRSAAVDLARVRGSRRLPNGGLVLTLEDGQRVPVSRRSARACRQLAEL